MLPKPLRFASLRINLFPVWPERRVRYRPILWLDGHLGIMVTEK
jgi:hypothetical protein